MMEAMTEVVAKPEVASKLETAQKHGYAHQHKIDLPEREANFPKVPVVHEGEDGDIEILAVSYGYDAFNRGSRAESNYLARINQCFELTD